MRKILKIALLFCVLIVFVSCKKKVNNDIYSTANIGNQAKPIFEITTINPFFLHENSEESKDYTLYNEAWYQLIEETFEIDVVSHSTYESRNLLIAFSMFPSNYGYLKKSINEGTISGLFKVSDNDVINQMIADNLILPLDRYLENNENWKGLPSAWKTAFEYENELWGIPSYSYETVLLRYIRKDWLNALDINEPKNIENFYEIMVKFTYDDPDKDGINNTSGACYNGLKGLEDIFTSFDVRINPNGYFLPTWNPNSDIWEDSIIKPEFIDCMRFLVDCKDKGVLVETKLINQLNDFQRGISGSFTSSHLGYNVHAEESIRSYYPSLDKLSVISIPGLEHYISSNLIGYKKVYSNPYVITKNSLDPHNTINIMIDTFIADKKGSMLGMFGVPNISFREDGDTIYLLQQNENEILLYPNLFITNPLYEYKIDSSFIISNDNQCNHESGVSEEKVGDAIYEIPWSVIQPRYDIDKSNYSVFQGLVANNIIENIITGFVSIEEGIEKYRKEAIKSGMQEFLDEQNRMIGKTSSQQYD